MITVIIMRLKVEMIRVKNVYIISTVYVIVFFTNWGRKQLNISRHNLIQALNYCRIKRNKKLEGKKRANLIYDNIYEHTNSNIFI